MSYPEQRPTLICFDGSKDAVAAIGRGGERLLPGPAVVLTVCEPIASWERYDPGSILTAPVSKLAAKALEVDEIVNEVAEATLSEGVRLAAAAGFTAEGRTARGKAWRVICEVAEEIDAATILLGRRGLSRIESMLLGSVSSAVALHARRPVLIVPAEPASGAHTDGPRPESG